MTWLGLVAAIVGSALLLAGTVYTAKKGQSASPYSALADRVVKLEAADETKRQQIETLRKSILAVTEDRDALVGYIKTLAHWVAAGAKPPAPAVPDHLLDLLPRHLWEWLSTPERVDDPPQSTHWPDTRD